jgi:hypothetical protein
MSGKSAQTMNRPTKMAMAGFIVMVLGEPPRVGQVSAVGIASDNSANKMGRFAKLVLLLVVIYAGSYAAFRQTNKEVWPKDKQTYVIFPSGAIGQALYYAWRPLAYADSALTGIRFHVGPHR